MANYSNQLSTNPPVKLWRWSDYREEAYSQGDWDIRRQKYENGCMAAVDMDDRLELSLAKCSKTLTTYESSTRKITEEEMALSLQTLWLVKNQPQNMIAQRPEGRYSLDGRRLALIVCDKSREGSQHDFERALQFGARHGFSCFETTEFTKAGVMEQLKGFKASLDEDVCCLTLFLMAHGSLGHIDVSDGQIELSRIFEMFDNRRCPALRGKPKLFVIQACRGVEQCSRQPCVDASELSCVDQGRLWPAESDALFVYAVCPGNLAIRYPERGSPLFEEMDAVFSRPHPVSVFEGFTAVNARLKERTERAGYRTDRLRPWQTPQNLVMPAAGRGRREAPAVGGPLHIVDRLTEKWYL